jgi:chemotaxis protein CheX
VKVAGVAPASNVHLEGWKNLLVLSVREVFQAMLKTKVAPVFEPAKALTLEWTAMIGLAGELPGVLMLSCDELSAIRIASKMLETPIEGPNEDCKDALGEACNMIAGNFKHKISGLSANCAQATPAVITGKDYRVHCKESGAQESVFVTFTFMASPIYVSLELQK